MIYFLLQTEDYCLLVLLLTGEMFWLSCVVQPSQKSVWCFSSTTTTLLWYSLILFISRLVCLWSRKFEQLMSYTPRDEDGKATKHTCESKSFWARSSKISNLNAVWEHQGCWSSPSDQIWLCFKRSTQVAYHRQKANTIIAFDIPKNLEILQTEERRR